MENEQRAKKQRYETDFFGGYALDNFREIVLNICKPLRRRSHRTAHFQRARRMETGRKRGGKWTVEGRGNRRAGAVSRAGLLPLQSRDVLASRREAAFLGGKQGGTAGVRKFPACPCDGTSPRAGRFCVLPARKKEESGNEPQRVCAPVYGCAMAWGAARIIHKNNDAMI